MESRSWRRMGRMAWLAAAFVAAPAALAQPQDDAAPPTPKDWHLGTQNGLGSDSFVGGQIVIGRYGFRRADIQIGAPLETWAFQIGAGFLDDDGYRRHSNLQQTVLGVGATYRFAYAGTLTGSFDYLDTPQAQDAGFLTLAEVQADRRQAHPLSVALDAGEQAERWRADLTYRNDPQAAAQIVARVFYTDRDSLRQLPFAGASRVELAADSWGATAQYGRELVLAGLAHDFTVGIDAERQQANRIHSFNDGLGIGPQTLHQDEQTTSWGLSAHDDIALNDRLTGSLGLRFEHLHLDLEDRLMAGGIDRSGNRRFALWDFTAGLSYALADDLRLHAHLGQTTTAPTFAQFADPAGAGGFNPNLDPQRALRLEAGVTGRTQNAHYRLLVHITDTRDELVPFHVADPADDHTYYRNAEQTRRYGGELSGTWFVTETISLSGGYFWSQAAYRRYEDGSGNTFDGNRIPGVSRHGAFAELAVHNPSGAYAILDVRYTGRFFADDANAVTVGSRTLVNLRLGVDVLLDGWRVAPFFAFHNLLGEDYYQDVRINADDGRYYRPAAGRQYFVGVSVRR